MKRYKQKKCSNCNQYPHQCYLAARGGLCKCIRRNCCVCPKGPQLPPAATFPRPCPCTRPECITTWTEYTKDEKESDDEDYIVFHCACHDISHGKTSFHCGACQIWVCQNCSYSQDLPRELGVDADVFGEESEVLCKPCYRKWLTDKLRAKAMKLVDYADSELAKLA